MAYSIGLGSVRVKSGLIDLAGEFTEWVDFDGRQRTNTFTAAIIDNSTTLSCTWTVQAKPRLPDGTYGNAVTVYTSGAASPGGVQTAQLAGQWQIRVGIPTTLGAGTATGYLTW